MTALPKYENVRLSDNDDSSITDVDDSVMGDDKHMHGEQYRPRYKKSKAVSCLSILKEGKWFLDTILLLVIVGLLLRNQTEAAVPKSSERDVGGDFTGVGPHLPTEVKTFHINQTFAPYNTSEFFKEEVLTAWNELMPSNYPINQAQWINEGSRLTKYSVGMGFQMLNDTSKYHDLPTPIIWPTGTVFTTSMTHQLHCLFAVVQTYSGLKANITLPEDHHWHMIHCFDYMRQAIMCSADMALEGLETTFPDHNGGSDGWDSKHGKFRSDPHL
ncbi:hypothetical protein LZ554_003205 [Drepanopeziza brunnea f. sp. 'monogermtubi']|nr:hypothetical protein LZ554_003205 [Drepanopeziza brunnea f. sp. 'monogermtubi']